MARGKKQSQNYELAECMCVDLSNYVVQANLLILSKQNMSLKAMKLIRLAIMQIKPADKELRTYKISVKELADILDVNANNLYSCLPEVTKEMMKSLLEIEDQTTTRFKYYNWTAICEYVPDDGLYIQLSDKLKPLLLNLRNHYTQYPLEAVVKMKSEYSIRFFELILAKINCQVLPLNGLDVYLSLSEIRNVCGCNSKMYDEFSKIKQKVIDKAISEVDRWTTYRITYSKENYLKQNRSVIGITFNVNMVYHVAKNSS